MKLIIERGKTVEFAALPRWSIALDGYVQGPAFDNVNHRYSFDHHKGCIRLVTTATCEQVRDAMVLGLKPDRFTVYLNDVDTDVALSVWALRNPSRLTDPWVGHYITAAGLLDAHGGAYPMVYARRQVEWMGEPETKARMDGTYEKLPPEKLLAMVDEIGERFERLLRGEAPSEQELRKQEMRAEYETLYEGTGWVLVRATDPHVLFDLYEQGIERVATCRQQSDGSFAYTLARRSDFVDFFDVPTLLAELNAIEPGWGGASTIGGAPRNADGSRSRLPPATVFDVVESSVRRQREQSLAEQTEQR